MASIRNELSEYGLFPKKGLGQHFLIDRNILNKVIRTAEVEKEDVVLEVGPGLGEMTLVLAHQVKKVIAIEIDSKLIEILKKKTKDYRQLQTPGQVRLHPVRDLHGPLDLGRRHHPHDERLCPRPPFDRSRRGAGGPDRPGPADHELAAGPRFPYPRY